MKLAFSTLGCPAWDLDTILSRAREYGFEGLELRGLLDKVETFSRPEFSTDLPATAARIAQAGLRVACFDSSVRLFPNTGENLQAGISEVRAYAPLCVACGSPFIRVFGHDAGDLSPSEAVKAAGRNLRSLADAVREFDIRVLLETHDAWAHPARVRAVMEEADTDRVGVVWDIHNAYRDSGESPAAMWSQLGPWVLHTHWKDSILTPADPKRPYRYCATGDGDIPLREAYACLKEGGYNGYLSLEWEKRWHPDIAEPEEAFPQFVDFARRLEK